MKKLLILLLITISVNVKGQSLKDSVLTDDLTIEYYIDTSFPLVITPKFHLYEPDKDFHIDTIKCRMVFFGDKEYQPLYSSYGYEIRKVYNHRKWGIYQMDEYFIDHALFYTDKNYNKFSEKQVLMSQIYNW